MRMLRQSTSVDLPVGPFLDSTDGVSPETGLTITQPDIRLKKNGGAWAQKNAAQTLAHEENGFYEVTLDATDTNTLGLLRLGIFEAGACPVWEEFLVMTPEAYDSVFAGTGNGLRADVRGWVGAVPNALASGRVDSSVGAMAANVLTATAIAANAITDTKIASGALTAAKFAAGAFDAVWSVATRVLTAGTNIVLVKGTGITGFNDLDAAGIRGAVGLATANLDTQLSTIEGQTDDIGAAGAGLTAVPWNAAWDAEVQSEVADALAAYDPPTKAELDAAVAPLATSTALATVDTVVDAIKITTDKLDDTLEDQGGGVFGFTAAALQEAPTGGSAPTVAEIADAVWEESLAAHSGTVGSTAEALAAAGSAGDPWATQLLGAYGAGSAGKIVGDNLNATVSSRASQTSVDDLPTNAELATALGTADDAVLAQVALVKAKTDQLTFTTANQIDARTRAIDTDAVSAAAVSADAVSEIAAGVRTNLTTELGRIDVAVSTRATQASVDTVDSVADAIKLKTDQLTFTTPNQVDARTRAIDTDAVSAGAMSTGAASKIAGAVRTELGTELGRIDAAVSTRATPAQVKTEADAALADVGLTTTVTGRIDVAISSRLAAAGYTTPPSATAVATQVRTELTPELARMDVAVSSRATPAQVNQEVLDVLTIDVFGQPASAPSASSSIKDMLAWLFTLGRNKVTQTSTVQTVDNDAETSAIAQASVSDDGVQFVRGKWQ